MASTLADNVSTGRAPLAANPSRKSAPLASTSADVCERLHIAHDFNNILQSVHGGAGLIEKRAADPANVRRLALMLVKAADRGAAITGRLLAFARRGDLRAERIDPAGLLDGLRDVLAQTLGSPVTVRVESGPGLTAVMADRGQLETALVNLAINARDAMPNGGTVTLAGQRRKLSRRTVTWRV